MKPLICLDTTLKGDMNIHILADHLHPFMSIVHSDRLGQFQQDSTRPELLKSDFRNTLLSLNTSTGYQTPQT
jgi:hypothetical protein